jgi:uncharacterized damage-inducible protein DinB
MSVEQLVIEFASRKLRQLEERIEICIGKLADDQLWSRAGENSNAAGNLCLHLAGNVRQWIVHGIGGAPDVRTRDAEFAARGGIPRQELLTRLRQTVEEACRVLDTLPPARLLDTITPQNYQVSVIEAMLHVVEHFAEHTGQIILLTKALTGEDLGFFAHLRGPAAPPPPPAGQDHP